MSIQTEINRLRANVKNTLNAIAAKGVTVPSNSTSDNMAGLVAKINTLTTVEFELDENGYLIYDEAAGVNFSLDDAGQLNY